MAWSEPEVMCKKHPDQRQQPGVCSSCLREKLAKVPSLRFAMAPSRSSSVSSSSSTCMSPTKDHAHQRKFSAFTGSGLGSNSFGVNGRSGLRKCRSITYVARRRCRNGGDGKKKEGFWSKLLRSTSMKTKGVFVHPNKTAKERSFEH